ncbi:MAG: hypothetical protein ACK521_08890, partial [bacterium]
LNACHFASSVVFVSLFSSSSAFWISRTGNSFIYSSFSVFRIDFLCLGMRKSVAVSSKILLIYKFPEISLLRRMSTLSLAGSVVMG